MEYSKLRSGSVGVEPDLSRGAVTEQVELLPRCRLRGRAAAVRADHDADVEQLHPDSGAVAGHLHLEVGAPARGDPHRAAGDRRRIADVDAVDRPEHEGHRGPRPRGPVVAVHQAHPHPLARSRHHLAVALQPVDRGPPRIEVADGDDVPHTRVRGRGMHQDAAEQSPGDLLVRQLVRVVPVGAGIRSHPAIGVLLPDPHGILGHSRDPVLGIRHVDPVPVQRHPSADGLVAQPHLDELAHGGLDQRAGRCPVDRETFDAFPRSQLHRALSGHQVDDHVGLTRRVGVEIGHAHAAGATVTIVLTA